MLFLVLCSMACSVRSSQLHIHQENEPENTRTSMWALCRQQEVSSAKQESHAMGWKKAVTAKQQTVRQMVQCGDLPHRTKVIKKIGPSPHQSQAAQQQLSAQSDLSSTTRVNHLLRLSSPWWRWWFQELHRHLSSMLIRARGCSSFLHSSISYLCPCSTVPLITSHFPCTFSTVLAVSAASPASVRFQLAPPKKKSGIFTTGI